MPCSAPALAPSPTRTPPPGGFDALRTQLAKKAAKKKQLKRGVKEVVKAIRKGTKGWVATGGGNVSPPWEPPPSGGAQHAQP